MPGLCALFKFELPQWNGKQVGKIAEQGAVGLTFDRRRGQPDLECFAVQSGDFAALGTRLHMQSQRQRFTILPVPAHSKRVAICSSHTTGTISSNWHSNSKTKIDRSKRPTGRIRCRSGDRKRPVTADSIGATGV